MSKEDPAHPRRVHLDIENIGGTDKTYVEFDTIESARDWRRELSGALYMHRHRRAANLYSQSDDDMTGVRISIPLNRVQQFSTRTHLSFINLLSVEVSKLSPRIVNSAGEPVSIGDDNSVPAGDDDSDDDDDSLEDNVNASGDLFRDSVDGRSVEFGVLHRGDAWAGVGDLVEAAKERETNATIKTLSRTFVDFGVLTFTEQPNNAADGMSTKEKAIRRALSLGAEKEIWCMSILFFWISIGIYVVH